MKVKELFVPRNDPKKIFPLLEEELSANPASQVYIDSEIYNALESCNDVVSPNYIKHFFYEHDNDGFGGETWLKTSDYRASFISNCRGKKVLVDFCSKKVIEYIHFLAEFEQLILIHFEER